MHWTKSATVVSLWMMAGAAQADEFGEEGQLAISSESALVIQHTQVGDDDDGTTQLTIGPAVDYFVIDNLSIGAAITLDYIADVREQTRFVVGPRIGYEFELSDNLSLWPKAGFSVAYTKVSTDVPETAIEPDGEVESDSTSVALNLYVPVLVYPIDHLFFGFGPFLDADLTGDPKRVTFGGKLLLGGWLYP